MKKTLVEVIKSNKKAIVKKALIVGGTAVGLAIVATVLRPAKGEDETIESEGFEEVENENSEESSEE